MASLVTRCNQCGTSFVRYGDGTQSAETLAIGPSFDTPECEADFARDDAHRQIDEARAALEGARQHLADVERAAKEFGARPGISGAEPHVKTIAELREVAEQNAIDLGEATLKSDIRACILDGLTVAGLRQFAREEGIELHGAQSRADIVAALSNEAKEPESAAIDVAIQDWQGIRDTPKDELDSRGY